MKIDDKLSEIFEIEPISKNSLDIIDSPLPVENDKSISENVGTDYANIRSNLYSILNQGQEALLHALEVAKQSEHPRAFEVVGNLMKNLSDINHQIIDLHTKRNSLNSKESAKEASNPTSVTNNAIFVGSTAELSQMIEKMKKGE